MDSGYANASRFLAPFRGERYHIGEFQGRRNAPYRSMRDKFNHRHAQLRNCVERAFGVLKMRFKTLKEGSCYPFRTQLLIVLACCVVHNYIRREHGEDFYFNNTGETNDGGNDDDDDDGNNVDVGVSQPDMRAGDTLRTEIANQLWLNN